MQFIGGSRKFVILTAALLVAQSGLALAEGAVQVDESIIVGGSYVVHKTTHLAGQPLSPVTEYTASQPVSYSGINLASRGDLDTFRNRVAATAKDLCGRLDAVSPGTLSENNECIHSATDSAMQKVTTALASSQQQPQKVASSQ